VAAWLSGDALALINEVALHSAYYRECVTPFLLENHLNNNQMSTPTQRIRGYQLVLMDKSPELWKQKSALVSCLGLKRTFRAGNKLVFC